MLKRIYNYKDSPLKVKSRARDYVKTFINDSIPYLEVFLPFSIAVISYHTSIILSYLEAEMTEEEVLKNEKVMNELIAQLIRIYLLDNYITDYFYRIFYFYYYYLLNIFNIYYALCIAFVDIGDDFILF